jgi:Zn-dependent protease with chaperone function
MIWPASGCLAACLVLATLAPWVGRVIQPALATRLLGGVCVAAAGSLLWVAALSAITEVVQIPVVARWGDWSPQLLRSTDPVPRWFAVACVAAAASALIAGGLAIMGRARGLATMRRNVGESQLTVIEDSRIVAFATPVRGGRVVVTTGALRTLPPDERRALLAHEEAHLRHHHYWWVTIAEVAAAMCPLFRATARRVAEAAERWADEDAAEAVGDRRVVARALARTALHGSAPRPSGAVSVAGGPMVVRVRAMLDPPPSRRLLPATALVVLLSLSLITAWTVGSRADDFFDSSSTPVASGHSGHSD